MTEKFTIEQVVAVRKIVAALSRNQRSIASKECMPETLSEDTLRRSARIGLTNIIEARKRELSRLSAVFANTDALKTAEFTMMFPALDGAIEKLKGIRDRI